MGGQNTELHDNPLLAGGGLPRFDQIEPEHIVPAVRHVLAEVERELVNLENNLTPTWSGLMEPLEQLDRPFEYAWSPVKHLFGVKNSPELRQAYETVLSEVVQFTLRAKQSQPIYEAMKAIQQGDVWNSLHEAQQRIIGTRLLHAELAGIGLKDDNRARFNQIAQELSQLSTDFANHVLDATKDYELILTDKSDIEGLPPSLLQLAAHSYNEAQVNNEKSDQALAKATADNGPWRFTLEGPILVPFLEHCRRRDLREELYRAFINRAAEGELDNSEIIVRTLQLRRESAQLLGYKTYAQVSLADKMASDVAAVEQMFETLRSASWEPAQKDLQDLKQLAAESDVTEPIMHWDVAFWAERLREKRFDYTDEQLRPYFPLERVLDGLFLLVTKLFNISVTPADKEAPVWHPDVRFFKITDGSGNQIAAFFLDPYSRPQDKRNGAWMDECLSRRRISNALQLPVAHLVCNGTPPLGNKPSLMTFREVETLFHEFGHGLQHMLTTVDYADAAGINGVEWDAVELPSQFMENWCYHKPTLLGFSGHFETGEPLPDDLFEKIRAARTYRSASLMLRQLLFGMTDMTLHNDFDPDSSETVFDLHRRISEKASVLPLLPDDRSLCAFQHIFSGSYAAGYYSYKWAEVLSADTFSAFEEAGLDNDQAVIATGRRFRDTVLALGGSRHPMQIFTDFRGREPNPEALLHHSGLA